jgi:hypothetical protein
MLNLSMVDNLRKMFFLRNIDIHGEVVEKKAQNCIVLIKGKYYQ